MIIMFLFSANPNHFINEYSRVTLLRGMKKLLIMLGSLREHTSVYGMTAQEDERDIIISTWKA